MQRQPSPYRAHTEAVSPRMDQRGGSHDGATIATLMDARSRPRLTNADDRASLVAEGISPTSPGSRGDNRKDQTMGSASSKTRGAITYVDRLGHVCTCTEATEYDDEGYPLAPSYLPTVDVDRSKTPTESGSYFYSCARCGAGGWSGC